ncbi:VTT domain-containing protein [Sinomonas sp. ASV486]|uniref:DedA family protein n=1 Tax=Sinomonas sp. ASV486 TaxID=3051170 RepID=UPI0027DAFE89|nr:VTT domain-containing protein [Sinomonas sp. ASV486]MDQ4489926.1 VTT domain-containing protein [Sinomonas sp. ASV486]
MSGWAALVLGLVPIVAADVFFPLVPAEVAVATAGALASEGKVDLGSVIALSALGSWVGDVVLFLLVRHSLSRLVDRWRWGRKLHTGTREALEQLGRLGAFVAIAGTRFLPGGRLASTATAGMSQVSGRGFVVSDAIGGLAWSAWMAGIGFVTNSTTDLPFWAAALISAGASFILASALATILARCRRTSAAADPEHRVIGP